MRAEVKVGLIVGVVAIAGGAIWWFSGNANELDSLPIDKRAMDATAPDETTLVGDVAPTPSGTRRPARRTETPPKPGGAESQLDQPTATARPGPESTAQPASPTTPAGEQTAPEPGKTAKEDSAEPSTPTDAAGTPDRGSTADTPPPEVDVPRRREAAAREPAPAPRTSGLPRPSAMKTYTIQRADRLIDLAREEYGDGSLWKAIKAVNPGIDENRLEIGATIYIPTEADARRLVQAALNQETPPPPKPRADRDQPPAGRATYVVERGDTLTKIARDVLNDATRWREIFDLNRDKLESADILQVGMELRLPPLEKD